MVKIYVASIDKLLEDSYFEQKSQDVSEERRKKIDVCKMQKDKARCLAAGLLLQFAWDEYNSKKGDKLEVLYMKNGKPICISDEMFHFNLSHSGKYVACAVSKEAVGIDIQQVKKVDLLIAKRFFLPEEFELIQKALPKEQPDFFCKLWVGKESYMKYTGDGMKQMMNTFMVDVEGNCVYDKKENQTIPMKWYFEIPDYQMAVCSLNGIFVEKPIFITL